MAGDLFEELQADYEKRKASKQLHRPLYDWLETITNPTASPRSFRGHSPAITGNPAVPSRSRDIAATGQTPAYQGAMDWMAANKARHPIYSGVGQNLGEDILYDRVDAITGERRDSNNVANIPLLPEGTVSQAVQGTTDVMDSVAPTEATQIAEQVAPAEAAREEARNALNQLQEVQVTAQKKVIEAEAAQVKQSVSDQLVAGGATEEEMSLWNQFTDKFDPMTFGMALLASNDGRGNLASNLGSAMMLARQAKIGQGVAAAASAAAGRKEARDERETRVREAKLRLDTEKFIAEERERGVEPTDEQEGLAGVWVNANPQYDDWKESGAGDYATKVYASTLAELETYLDKMGITMSPPEKKRFVDREAQSKMAALVEGRLFREDQVQLEGS